MEQQLNTAVCVKKRKKKRENEKCRMCVLQLRYNTAVSVYCFVCHLFSFLIY